VKWCEKKAGRGRRALRILVLSAALIVGLARVSSAQHPLITDDAGTLGKGRSQIEINAEYGSDEDNGTVQHTTPAVSAFTYGLSDTVDVSIGVPYLWTSTGESATTTSLNGFGDMAITAKWRFYEKDGVGFALKPGITLPTGDKDKELGTGRMTYSLFFIATRETGPWAFHLNLGYIANENEIDQRVPIWHVSVATEVEVAKGLKLVVNTGIQRNTEKDSNANPAFLLGGVVYSITDDIDIDAGYKYGLTRPEVDHKVLAGVTFHF
jgi:Putative MetA-pathway of phenol degradation